MKRASDWVNVDGARGIKRSKALIHRTMPIESPARAVAAAKVDRKWMMHWRKAESIDDVFIQR